MGLGNVALAQAKAYSWSGAYKGIAQMFDWFHLAIRAFKAPPH